MERRRTNPRASCTATGAAGIGAAGIGAGIGAAGIGARVLIGLRGRLPEPRGSAVHPA